MYNMTIRLQADSDVCLYEQIYTHIKNEIIDGKLLTGEKLPSTRSLAEFLQVARSTVEYAYGQLTDEGYIESRPYSGYFVCEMEEKLDTVSSLQELPEEQPLSESKRAEAEAGIAEKNGNAAAEPQKKYAYDFSPFGVEMEGFPFDTWRRITKKVLSDANSELFSRGEPQGDSELRQTICRYLHNSRGVNCRPDQIIVGAGNDYLLLLLEKILGSDRTIGMEDPTYLRSVRIFRSFGYRVQALPMDEYGLPVEALKAAKVQIAYVMPSHQFPSGVVMPVRRRTELLNWAARDACRYIIEDDYDSEFRFRGKPIPALQSMDENGRVIYLGSFSKAIAPAIRVSFMVLPEVLLEKYRRDCFFYSCTVSRIDQSILNDFIKNGHFERHLNKMRKIYRQKHDLLLDGLENLGSAFTVSGENAGLHVVVKSKYLSEEEMTKRAALAGIRVYGLSDYRVEEAGEENSVLLGFGNMSREKIREGCEILCDVWRK